MSVTINAHQLGRLIDQTINHIGGEYIEPLHGIRLDVDATHLYAVASDRYTLAVARYRLNHGDQNQEPFARTIPAEYLRPIREWLDTMKGAAWITISTAKDRLVFEGPQTDLSIAVNPGLEFPDWRGLLRGIAEQTVEGQPFPALNSDWFARFSTGNILRVRVTADQKAILVFGEDFIGAQMPARHAGVGPVKDETFDSARALWKTILAEGDSADMATAMPDEEPGSHYEASKDIRETGEYLLREVLRSTSDVFNIDYDADRDLWHAHIRTAVGNWMAYRYLDALYQVDPRAAQAVVDDTAEQLDAGELGEFAWDTAEEAGHNPKKWDEDHKNAVAEQNAKSAPAWAERLAMGLNAAQLAGISFRVDDNPHVTYDEQAEQWVAVKPKAAEVSAS